MKIAAGLALLPLAAQAALSANGWAGGRRGLALVAKRGPDGYTYATRDGGSNSASFRGEAPKGGSLINDAAKDINDAAKDINDAAKDINDAAKDAKKALKDANPLKEDPVPRVGPFWESKLFKEGGLGFLFGLGTGVCARKANKGAACAVSGVLVAAQYMSRADIFGCGGKLGWPKLGYFEQREFAFERDNYGFVWRASRSIKQTVRESLETCEGYALGLALGLKGPIS